MRVVVFPHIFGQSAPVTPVWPGFAPTVILSLGPAALRDWDPEHRTLPWGSIFLTFRWMQLCPMAGLGAAQTLPSHRTTAVEASG